MPTLPPDMPVESPDRAAAACRVLIEAAVEFPTELNPERIALALRHALAAFALPDDYPLRRYIYLRDNDPVIKAAVAAGAKFHRHGPYIRLPDPGKRWVVLDQNNELWTMFFATEHEAAVAFCERHGCLPNGYTPRQRTANGE